MTEAGWTHGKDLSAEEQSFMASVKVLIDAIEQEAYQQGRVEGLRECKHGLDIALDEGPLKAALYRWIDARAERLEREAQQAQEGGLGDANG